MQDNTITLAVDTANTGTTTDKAFRRYSELQNKSTYIGPGHSLSNRNELAFFRTPPKANGNFKGMAKSAIKFTYDVDVEGTDNSTTNTAPIIIDISFSLPVGTTAADALLMRQHAVSILDMDAIMVKIHENLEI